MSVSPRKTGLECADQRGQAQWPDRFGTREQQANRTDHQADDRDSTELHQLRGFRPLRSGFLSQAALEHQQAEGQCQRQRRADAGRLTNRRRRQGQVPELEDADQRQQRPTDEPQHGRADLGKQPAAESIDQVAVPGGRLNRWLDQLDDGPFQRLGAPIGHPPRRLQAGHQHQQGRRAVDQHHRPDRQRRKQRDKQRQYPATDSQQGQADTGLSQSTGMEQPLLKTRQAFYRGAFSF